MKRIILTLSSGRAGTDKLTSVLSTVPRMISEHEAEPCYSRIVRKNFGDPVKGQEFVRTKLDYIETLDCDYYCDTTFVIAEGFVEHFLYFNVVPDAIVLRRDLRASASSMYRLGRIPGREATWETGERFLINPYFLVPDQSILKYPGWEDAHDYQLCYWFCREMELRAMVYSDLLKTHGATITTITTNELSNLTSVNKMLRELKLNEIDTVTNEKVNTLDSLKYQSLPNNLDELEGEVNELV